MVIIKKQIINVYENLGIKETLYPVFTDKRLTSAMELSMDSLQK